MIEAELLVRPERDKETAVIEQIEDLLSEDGIYVVDVDRRIARRAASIRARGGGIGLPDAIIIATALETGCDLIVGNDKDWLKLPELPYVLLDHEVDQTAGARESRLKKER